MEPMQNDPRALQHHAGPSLFTRGGGGGQFHGVACATMSAITYLINK